MSSGSRDGFSAAIRRINDFTTYKEVWAYVSRLEFDASVGELDAMLVEDWQEIVKHLSSGEEVLVKSSILGSVKFHEAPVDYILIGRLLNDTQLSVDVNAKLWLSVAHPMRDSLMHVKFRKQVGHDVYFDV